MSRNTDRVNSMTLERWQRKMDKLQMEVEDQQATLKATLGRVLKNPEIKKALNAEKNQAIRRSESGALSPVEKALIQASRSGGELGNVGIEGDYIDYNEMVSRPWEKD